ncbi:hypothetical protein DEU56DRAFT_745392 [Suillus clintonianus]|uniref:uncharacterized protein n=1 Tax=Suillus clintonianus TaxID=1904413 RepID=UPI001B87B9B1|nr:uncharacterized protein DEU56DRAFT_745392 [Suillus clintonianus]KAG2123417.1 hypothetical protein DEU56DRAFT_745392 [Suillus clintonianus]
MHRHNSLNTNVSRSPSLSQRKLVADFRSPSPLVGGSSSVSTTESHQTVITKTSWLEAARESTNNFKLHGSALPLVWVLVEDNVIPSNAVPFGEDKTGFPLYIARALLEVGLSLPRAGAHLQHALISYGGREHQIQKYEVLVCASQLRWGLATYEPVGSLSQGTTSSVVSTTLCVNDIPRFIPNLATSPRVEESLKKLADYKTVVLIDDSISVGMAEEQSWTLVREALAGIADLANQYGSQGIDLHFLHHEHFHQNIKTSHEIQHIFNQMAPNGPETPTAAKLEELINFYLPLVERKFPQHNPIDIIVITDGVATDQQDLPEVIVSAAHRLERSQVPEEMFGIQFVQIGTDAEAASALRALDDHLAKQYKIRDIVDTTPYDPQQGAFNTDYMLKILLGGVNKVLDNGGPVPSELLSPLAVPYGSR